MIHRILLKSDGKFYTKDIYDASVEGEISSKKLINFLLLPVEIDKSVTLKDLFKAISPVIDIVNDLVGFWIKELWKEITKEPNNKQKGYIRLKWSYDKEERIKYLSVSIIIDNIEYDIASASPESYANLPIKIQTTGEETQFPNLLTLLKDLAYQLTFYGSPSKRDKNLQEIFNLIGSKNDYI